MNPEPGRLILVVEDDPGAGVLQRRRLERAGFRVALAAGVDDALDTLAAGGVSLVVIDYRLGTTTGLDLHRQMKGAGLDVPVILVSGAIDDATVIEAIRAGVRDVVVKGTDYLDYLPDAVQGVLSQAAAVPAGSAQASRPARVLIVDDEPGIAALQKRHLERVGYTTEVAYNVADALETVSRGDVTLAIIDLRLGAGASGLDLYDRIKAEGWNVPAILVTGFPDQNVAIRALRSGIRDFVPKSAEYLEYLPAAVERVVAQINVERRLVESELRMASIIGTTMDAIAMCDEDLRIVLFNRSAEEMFACPAAEALGRRLDAFIPGLALHEPSGGNRPPAGEIRSRLEVNAVRTTGARVPIEVSISDVVVHGRRLFTVIARDVSERRRIEAELREADRRKDEFLGMLAHELRNPLAAIMTAGEVLDRMVQEPPARKLMSVVKRQTRALARMVDDLLDVSRVTLGKIQIAREPVLWSQIVSRAAEGAREAMARGQLQFDVRVDPEPVWLNGDSTRLEQVLTNLLNNAAKFTPPGGRVTLEAIVEGNTAVVRVRDTGIGIDPAVLPRVFDLFVQADRSLDRAKSGLGIGLALVRKIVTLHGGDVRAFSEGPGKGSEFSVRLPVALENTVPAPEGAPVLRQAERPLRVLVVDDQADIAESVALLIRMLGHEVRTAANGAEALASMRAERCDIVFVDVGMPGMTGYDMARRVRVDSGLADVRLVALTGYGRDEDRTRALQAGFDLHLTKPVSDGTLEALLASIAPAKQPD